MMNPFLSFFIRTFVALPVIFFTGLISFLGFDQSFLFSTGIALAGGAAVYLLLGAVMTSRFLKKHQLTRKEYRYIMKNLQEAKQKINRLNKAMFLIRDIQSLKQRIDVLRIAKKIHSLTKNEPKRFYKAEKFFFSHLDSVVELSEKYRFLSQQPKKSFDIDFSLQETRKTLAELTKALEDDLYVVISDDLDHLNFEIDVAKHSIKTLKDSKFDEENRRLK